MQNFAIFPANIHLIESTGERDSENMAPCTVNEFQLFKWLFFFGFVQKICILNKKRMDLLLVFCVRSLSFRFSP